LRTAIVLMTHRFDPSILAEFERMRAALHAGDRAFVLSDAEELPDDLAAPVHRFTLGRVATRAKRLVGHEIMWNLHLAWLDFFDAHADFDHYWFIEYDAVYAGPWRDRSMPGDQPHDLFCAHLRRHAEEPDWHWWHEIHPPDGVLDPASCVRGFLPIARLSRHGFAVLRDQVRAGWSGFFEGLLPTLLHLQGLRIGDFGGDGAFVPEGFRERFYTSASDRAGSLHNLGTHRFRPPLAYPRILPGRIYHPVKPESCLVDAGVDDVERSGAAIANALEQIRQRRQQRAASGTRDVDLDTVLQALTGLDVPTLRNAIERHVEATAGDHRFILLRQRLERLVDAAA
jgi:hypothetical protein